MSALSLFAEGPLAGLAPDARRKLLERAPTDDPELERRVSELMADVRERGDAALLDMARRFEAVEIRALEVPHAHWKAAARALDPSVRRALERAATNLRRFHEAQLPSDVTVDVEPGVRVTRRWVPLERVGVYAPGGRAAYPSSVLMGVVPARAAGVREVIVCSPAGPRGKPPAEVLAACEIAGADRLFAVGGAGAVAAMAWGTGSVPAADAIVGPGNRWVTEAKRQVAGRVPIDSPAGPSEVLVVADASADAAFVAGELLAQAEHDPDACCVAVLVAPSAADVTSSARRVRAALVAMLERAPRGDVAGTALARAGALLTTTSMEEAVAFARAYAPEHLSVMTADAAAVASRIPTAGAAFLGAWTSVVFGDYLTGANHVLPTAGRARSFSGLSVQHCMRSFTVQEITAGGAAALAGDVAVLAASEGLPAHAAAALLRRSP